MCGPSFKSGGGSAISVRLVFAEPFPGLARTSNMFRNLFRKWSPKQNMFRKLWGLVTSLLPTRAKRSKSTPCLETDVLKPAQKRESPISGPSSRISGPSGRKSFISGPKPFGPYFRPFGPEILHFRPFGPEIWFCQVLIGFCLGFSTVLIWFCQVLIGFCLGFNWF